MQSSLRKMGNSTGLVLPKPILQALGVGNGTAMELVVENGRVIATPVRKVREGWEEAVRELAKYPLTQEEEDWLHFPGGIDDDAAEWVW